MNEPPVPLLPGQINMVLWPAAALTFPLAWMLLRRYVKAVEQAMRTAAPQAASAEVHPPAATRRAAFTGSSGSLLDQLQRAPWRSAAIQAIIAVVIGVYFGMLKLTAAGLDLSGWRVITLGTTYMWPGALAVLFIAGISRRQRLIVLLAAAALYLAFGIWAHTGSIGRAFLEVLVLWVFTNILPSLFLLSFIPRRVRAVGPLVLLIVLMTVGGMVTAFSLLIEFNDANEAMAGVLLDLGFGVAGVLLTYALVGGGVGLLLALWMVRQLASAYARYRVGDEGLALAAFWLTFILMYSVNMLFDGSVYFVLGLAAFPAYLIMVRVARKLFLPAASADAPALLLLRVFARKGTAVRLFHAISRHWRHVGPIRMIAGYDLARDTVEPDEMMAFLRGRLADSFITGPEVVARRLGSTAPQRDADARYRSEEFFCFDNTWRDTLQRLVASSAVILMDLRGFGPNNTGCIFELEALSAFGALPRTVLLHDATTNMPVLHESLRSMGVDARALNLLPVHGDEARDITTLLQALSQRAVGQGSVAVGV